MTMSTPNDNRPLADQIWLRGRSEGEGWPFGLWLGGDKDTGWIIECDMEDGRFAGAFTPAGGDPLFLMSAREVGPRQTVATITVEAGEVRWNPETRTLTIWNGEAEPVPAGWDTVDTDPGEMDGDHATALASAWGPED